jgi:hypothetical protein
LPLWEEESTKNHNYPSKSFPVEVYHITGLTSELQIYLGTLSELVLFLILIFYSNTKYHPPCLLTRKRIGGVCIVARSLREIEVTLITLKPSLEIVDMN